ncbi:MAG: phosphoribosylglycinamide formyltransferase [Bdellovibrio sp.]|nr:phosphoribosylglycinamide formyltransferase [Bdellovibrio sp.]
MKPLRIAIFASGTGSNALALIKKAQELSAHKIEITFVLSDNAQAPVLEKAKNENIRTFLVTPHKGRANQEQEILNLTKEYKIDWIFLAGYMRLISPSFLRTFADWHSGCPQIVNIHPSLLPGYPGLDSIARAYHDQVSQSGVTLHLVDAGMDTGKILLQKSLPLAKSESLETWKQKFHLLEHEVYGQFLESLASGQISSHPFQEPA